MNFGGCYAKMVDKSNIGNSNICKPEEGWYGRPKYCYEKTIHLVLNQLCSSLWTSRS